MRSRFNHLHLLLIAIFILAPCLAAAKNVFVGISAAMSGPTKNLGVELINGIEAYFEHFNRSDSNKDFRIKLIALDDSYEPYLTRANMLKLINDEKIIAAIGNVGTPTATVAVTLANDYKLLLFGAFTGAEFLRKVPPDRYIINFRASYQQEMYEIARHIQQNNIPFNQVAFFVQDDAFGYGSLRSAYKALEQFSAKRSVIDETIVVYYPRNTVNIENALSTLSEKDPARKIKAFVVVGTDQPTTRFIMRMKNEYPGANFYNLSFVGAKILKNSLCRHNQPLCHEYTRNVFVSQIVPDITDDRIPIVTEYKTALKNFNSSLKPNPVSFEGYIIAKIFAEALKTIDGQPTRENIIDAIENLKNIDIGLGFLINFDKNRHQASDKVWLLQLNH